LPEIVQFRNGNQIKYLYDARGQKLKVDYFTCLKVIDPIQETQVGNWTYTPNEIDKFSNVFIGNMMYRLSNTVGLPDNPQLIKIENPEGYSSSGGQKWYYRRDHLGSVREVWWQYRNLTMQSTQYYPSGLPWAEGTGVGTQLNKYNGKLWDEMHGWEETDMGWRGQYPAINTFGSIDRKAEKYPWQSPYCVANNNTVKFIDLNGEGAPKNYCNGMRTRDIDWFIEKNNLLFLDKKYKFKDPQKINSDNTSIKVPEKRESILAPQGFVLKEALKTAISTDKHAQLSQTDKMQ